MKTAINAPGKSRIGNEPCAQILFVTLLWLIQTLSVSAQPVSYCSGLSDNYVCPEEPVSPDSALLAMLTAQHESNPCFSQLEFDNFPGLLKCNGDPIPQNAFFIHQLSFPVVPGSIVGATLQFRAKAAPTGQTNTDFIAFFEGPVFITGANLRQLAEAAGSWNPNQDASFTLALGNLPAAFSTNSILSYLQDGDLDVLIGNETGVDWMCITPSLVPCCINFDVFSQTLENAVSISTDNALHLATVSIADLPACDSIRSIDWGDGQLSQGPFGSNAMVMHTYAGVGSFAISILGQEFNDQMQPPQLCFEKLLADTVLLTVPTEDPGLKNSIRLFPNPTAGTLTLEFTGEVPGDGAVQILDRYGRQLYREDLANGQRMHSLSVAALPAGMYFLRVTAAGVPVWTEKVVKE
jgi:hypothetical protein